MRNVSKGFEFGGMAIPKFHAGKINASFTSFHNNRPPEIKVPRPRASTPKPARRPGKNPGIRNGYLV